MIETQYITLDMKPSGVLPVLYCSQYDIGRPLGMVVYNGGEVVDLGDYSATIEATRTDGVAITAAVTTDGNVGAFETTATMTNQADRYGAQLVLSAFGKRVASLPFVMCVVKAAMDENAESIEEDASLYQQYTETVQTLIANIRADLESISDSINALDAETDAANANIAVLQTLAGRNNTERFAVFIGDSYTHGSTLADKTKAFPNLVSAKLGLTCKNFSVAGAGFIFEPSSGTNFPAQVNAAIADTSFDNDNVSYVIISGGLNDSTTNPSASFSDIKAAVDGMLTAIETNMPNAEIVLIPTLYNADYAPKALYTWYCQLTKAVYTSGHKVRLVRNAYAWLTGRFGCMNSDGPHPNYEGHIMIASCILDAIGGGTGFLNVDRMILNAGNKTSNVDAGITNNADEWILYATFQVTSALARGEGILSANLTGYSNIPAYIGTDTIYGTLYRTDNYNNGAYHVSINYNPTSHSILLRSLAEIPVGSYQVKITAPFGRVPNAVTG